MIKVTRETTAELTTGSGERVKVWTNDREPRHVSIAVPRERARMTPAEVRELAAGLLDMANTVESLAHSPLRDGAKAYVPFPRVAGL